MHEEKHTHTLHLPRNTWLALLGLGLALYAIISLLPILINVALLLFLVVLLALLISPLADRLAAHRVRRSWTVSGVLLIIVAVFVYLVVQLLPLIGNSLRALSGLTENLGPEIQSWLPDLIGEEMTTEGGMLFNIVSDLLSQAAGLVGGIAGQLGTIFFTLFVLVVLVATLVNDPRVPQSLLRFFVPARHHTRVISLTHKLSDGLARWFGAQFAISCYYIISYAVVNTLLGVPYALPISVIAGLLEFIPYLGGLVGLVLSVLAAATVSLETVIWVVVTNTIIGSAAVYFVSPYFYSRAINIPVAAVLLGLYIGGQVGGFFAALLTIPVVTMLIILLRELRFNTSAATATMQPAEEPEEPEEAAPLPERA